MGYLDLVGSFIYQEPVFRAKLDALAENDEQLKDDGWATNTKLLFFSSAVPTGWTKDATQHDKALRLVGSTGGAVSGGSQALSTTIAIAHTHTIDPDDSHTHTYSNHTHNGGPAGSGRISNQIISDNAGFLFRYTETGGSTTKNYLRGILATPGALTLGTRADHDHGGVTEESLDDFVFQYSDVLIGTKDAPAGTYTDLTSFWSSGTKIDYETFQEYADNDAYNQENLMPSSSVVIFGQATAPAGWTKISTDNDRILRVVNTTGGGNGGDRPISSGVSLAHSHVVEDDPDHTHSVPAHTHSFQTNGSTSTAIAHTSATGYVGSTGTVMFIPSDSGSPSSQTVYKTSTVSGGSGNTEADGGHTHDIVSELADFILAYVDVIQCSKDSAGAPYAYDDMTAVFAFKQLVSYQRMNRLAKNDAHILFHTTPMGTKTFFFMSTPPTGWTKITSQHGKALRMVSGASGGTAGGGSQLVSDTIVLAHTHDIIADGGHTHDMTHTHTLDSGTQSVNPQGLVCQDYNSSGKFGVTNVPSGGPGSQATYIVAPTSQAPNEDTAAQANHDHGGVTDSMLSNVSLAYADVIWCTKN